MCKSVFPELLRCCRKLSALPSKNRNYRLSLYQENRRKEERPSIQGRSSVHPLNTSMQTLIDDWWSLTRFLGILQQGIVARSLDKCTIHAQHIYYPLLRVLNLHEKL